ncbi:MAG TPA: hypothetical protein VHT28_11190 [Silvibacterium sp.]|nr:hypothetical protein [Silvibacterium sp.]
MAKFLLLSRWSSAIALSLAVLTCSAAAWAQDPAEESATDSALGAFTVENTPSPEPNNFLFDISGASENNIWAVGSFATGALAIHFDGTRWTAIPMALPNLADMRGVSALSATDVWAVGSEFDSNTQHNTSVIQHFDGKRWNLVTSPQFPTGSQLFAVKALAVNDVFAVGETDSDSFPQAPEPLIEHFDGIKWSIVLTPEPTNGMTASLHMITGTSHTDLWVLGATNSGPGLLLHFDGDEFSNVTIPFPKNTFLGGITAIAANDVWAVATNVQGVKDIPITAHWNGKAWKVVLTPSLTTSATLGSVAAVSSTSVWAAACVSCGADIPHGQKTLIEHWDGKSWTAFATPLVGSPRNGIGPANVPISILAFPSGNVYVAGFWANGLANTTHTLVYHTTE